ncbi:MAG: ribonuclease H family protein [Candidatus Liptonbacteria bacterium]|nr:ribonuclease H family protein [Candidatus Liptonbacteria bacterium]
MAKKIQNLFGDKKKKSTKYYAWSIPGGGEGVAEEWGEAEKRVSGKQGARFKGFKTREEAEKWLALGADYGVKHVQKIEPGIYFDAGTGRGEGVEISVTNEKGKNLLHKAISKVELTRGKHLLGKEVTNNYGELLACKYAIEIAMAENIKKVFGDSKLVIEFWTRWRIKKDVPEETFKLAREAAGLRKEFEEQGGEVIRISGDDNPADLGFH